MRELIKKIKTLTDKLEKIADIYDEIDDINFEIEQAEENSIIDLDKFKRQLEQQNLMTKELEEFIEIYMRFDNKC